MNKLANLNRWQLYTTFCNATLLCAALLVLCSTSTQALDGGTLRVNTFNGWQAFEVITQNDDPAGDGFNYSMPGTFDGAGAWLVDASTLRVLVNHETGDASISEVNLDVASLQAAISNVISTGNIGAVSFVVSARQAYGSWSSDGGASFANTSNTSNTNFSRFCSGQAYAANTFGPDRGFVDPIYITGEEVSGGRLFALDSVVRDFYQLSGTIGSAPGGIGGMPFDSWENAALVDTGETGHIALMLSPDGGTQSMKLYIGVKGLDASGNASDSFLARNGLAYGSWYYFNGSLPSLGVTNDGTFDTISSSALTSSKLEDIDTSPSNPTQVVLGDQDSGVFTFDLNLAFSGGFNAEASSFTVTKISNTSGGDGSLDNPDNVDWTAVTNLGGAAYPEGIIFLNEDNSSGEIWRLSPDGSSQVRIGQTTVGAESTGVFDLSAFVGYAPGSILITNNQGSPSSMAVLINPDATADASSCGDSVCDAGENPLSCPQDCPDVCGDGVCEPGEDCSNCPSDCISGTTSGAVCGNGICEVGTGEDCVGCPTDCNGKQNGKPSERFCCGNGGEKPVGCQAPQCTTNGFSCTTVSQLSVDYCCGDAVCEGNENITSCAVDCDTCGNGSCDVNEDHCTCPADCGGPSSRETVCDDGVDDDCDGVVDCADSECSDDVACQACSMGQIGAPCTSDADCCSNKCTGKRGSKTCK